MLRYKGQDEKGYKRISHKTDNAFTSVVKSTGDIMDALSEWLKSDERVDILYLGNFTKGKVVEIHNSIQYLKQYERIDINQIAKIENMLKQVHTEVEAMIEDACKEEDKIK